MAEIKSGSKSEAFQPFTLPNGTVLKNRIAKAAMEEKIADVPAHNQPSKALEQLYKTWGEGGSSLVLSGHIMIDPKSMAAPSDVLLAEDAGEFDEAKWRRWIDATQANGAQFWFQINHPGRQIMKGSGLPTYGPSAVPMKMGGLSKMFGVPIAMTDDQIQDVIKRFAWTAKKAEELGVSGVQIHAAHGYLLSQFLSPLVNQRTDRWGGSLENRARLLLEVVRAIRKSVSSKFGVGVKINTADFQRGGFAREDFMEVVRMLNNEQLDLIEVSGGNYESPAMAGAPQHDPNSSTAKREAYFLEAAKEVLTVGTMPIMVTGGIRRVSVLNEVLGSSDRFIAGIGTAMGLVPDLPNRWMNGEDPAPALPSSWVLSGPAYAGASVSIVQRSMTAIGKQASNWLANWPLLALLSTILDESRQMKRYKKWFQKQQELAA